MTSVSVVVPVYNSEPSLEELVNRLEAVLTGDHEIILVDDGSADGSAAAIRRIAAAHPHVRGVFLMRNFGQHNALLAGIRQASCDTIVTIDDDLQNPPEEIPKLVELLARGNDLVYGKPARPQHYLWRQASSRLIRLALGRIIGSRMASIVSPFRAFRSELRRAFDNYSGPYVSIDVLLSWGAGRVASVDVDHAPRKHGRSTYRPLKLASHAVNMLTGYSTWPLRLASIIGFFFTVFGVGVLTYVVGRYLMLGYSVAGFPFLASIIAIFSGAQLFALGIIGEYLGKVHFRMMDRPPYVIDSTTADEGR